MFWIWFNIVLQLFVLSQSTVVNQIFNPNKTSNSLFLSPTIVKIKRKNIDTWWSEVPLRERPSMRAGRCSNLEIAKGYQGKTRSRSLRRLTRTGQTGRRRRRPGRETGGGEVGGELWRAEMAARAGGRAFWISRDLAVLSIMSHDYWQCKEVGWSSQSLGHLSLFKLVVLLSICCKLVFSASTQRLKLAISSLLISSYDRSLPTNRKEN